MIHDIPMPAISPAFTIDDIHKIREWNYERLKDATPEEKKAYYTEPSNEVEREIEKRRRELAVVHV